MSHLSGRALQVGLAPRCRYSLHMHLSAILKSSVRGLTDSSSEAVAKEARKATTGGTEGGAAPRRDPDVVAIAKRRQFSGSEKRRLLAEADRCKQAGTPGAFLRRERIYSPMRSSWRSSLARPIGGRSPPRGGAQTLTPRPGRSSTSRATTPGRAASSSARSWIIAAQKNYVLNWDYQPRRSRAKRSGARRGRAYRSRGAQKRLPGFRAEPGALTR